jgi:hypothetical protein
MKINHFCLPIWSKRIDQAEKRGHFTKFEIELSNHWKACAVGEAHKRYSKLVQYNLSLDPTSSNEKYPNDHRLRILGYDFYDATDTDDFKKARNILKKIEKRLKQLEIN